MKTRYFLLFTLALLFTAPSLAAAAPPAEALDVDVVAEANTDTVLESPVGASVAAEVADTGEPLTIELVADPLAVLTQARSCSGGFPVPNCGECPFSCHCVRFTLCCLCE